MGRYDRFKPLNDMYVGEQFWSNGRTITEADCVLFTSLAGLKAPLFVDEEYSKKHGRFGRRVVPGLLTASLTAGMMEDILGPYVVAALELSTLKFPAPIFHQDTVRCVFTVLDIKPKSKPDTGILVILSEMFNQDDKKVFELTGTFIMKRSRIED